MQAIDQFLRQYMTDEELSKAAQGDAHAVLQLPHVHERVTVRCLEAHLRTRLGVSRKSAKKLIAKGWKQPQHQSIN